MDVEAEEVMGEGRQRQNSTWGGAFIYILVYYSDPAFGATIPFVDCVCRGRNKKTQGFGRGQFQFRLIRV